MQSIPVEFTNEQHITLKGVLEKSHLNTGQYALFAHCFTCSKDIRAARVICASLAKLGISTLRFDFTGIGMSEGEFSESNFSTNVQDLVSACRFLSEQYATPSILVGHSLGGAAVLAAAEHLPSIKAVATMGAPSNTQHLLHHFDGHEEDIETKGQAKVSLAGRPFLIKKQFVDDLKAFELQGKIKKIKAALLVMHSPLDETVSIDEAQMIYTNAMHPKSFITLDKADHLLSKIEDAEYCANILSSWVTRYVDTTIQRPTLEPGQVQIEVQDGFTQNVYTHHHHWVADEPTSVGGLDLGPNPYEQLLSALGTCSAMTLHVYAKFKKIKLPEMTITLTHTKDHSQDCVDCESESSKIDIMHKKITILEEVSDELKAKIQQIADKCPVHRTLHNEIEVKTTVE